MSRKNDATRDNSDLALCSSTFTHNISKVQSEPMFRYFYLAYLREKEVICS